MNNLLIFVTLALSSATSVMSKEISISPLILYEQANAPLIIDGVSSGYKFGIIGVSGQLYPNNKNNAQIDVGLGYIPSEAITFAGATFTGPFTGKYFSISGEYYLKSFDTYDVFLNQSFSHRNTQSTDLFGQKNSAVLSGTAVNIINSYDTILRLEFAKTSISSFSLGGGFSFWSFKARGTAANLSNTVRATKNISTLGLDPLILASFQTKFNNKDLNIHLKYRSLNSKFKTGIGSINLKYEYLF